MRVIFMGAPEFAVPALESLFFSKYEIVAVYTQPDKTAGRGQAVSNVPVKRAATTLGLPIFQPETLKAPAEQIRIASFKPDVIVVAAYGHILPNSILKVPVYGCLNIHPSLLPNFRGVAPVPAAIIQGVEFTGVSIILLDRGIDSGPILSQSQIPIASDDTSQTLLEKLSNIGAALLVDVLPRLKNKQIVARHQDKTLASYTRRLQKSDGEINWYQTAVEISRQVRAYQPWPSSFTYWQSRHLKIIEAIACEGMAATPGKVVTYGGELAFGIETGAGILGIKKVQLEGKKVMSADEFIRGQRQLIGVVLPTK